MRKKYLPHIALLLSLVTAAFFLVVPSTAYAECRDPYPVSIPTESGAEMCCPKTVSGTGNEAIQKCTFEKYINPVIFLLSLIVGVAVVGGIIWGGIQYSMSAGDPQKVTKAKSTITKALTALVIFLVFVPAVMFLSPGGLNPNPPNSGNASTKTCAEANKFLGLKPWFAYLPEGSFDSGCNIKDTVVFLPGPADTSGKTNQPGVLPNVILAIVDSMLRIAALVAVIFVIVGGVKYMTSQGEPAQTKQALSSIINALIGLAVAMVAALVVSFIGRSLSS